MKEQKKRKNDEITYTFPVVKVKGWKIYGFLRQETLIVKAKAPNGREKLLRFNYNKRFEAIREGYEEFIKDRL